MSADVSNHSISSSCEANDQQFVNIAAYLFVTLDELERRKKELKKLCLNLSLKGTILLTPEGINIFIAGQRDDVDQLLAYLRQDPVLTDLPVKESFSDYQPFKRMLIKIKNEIIVFSVDGVDPRQHTSKKIQAQQLKEWLDAGKEVMLLDTRNDYEVKVGTFENAVPIGVDHFRDFPKAVAQLPEETKDRPIVMFCTGGIRCEKAGPFMEQAGFRDVYQLDGGILKYFEECGGEHYDGECFVFDKRVALDSNLKETETTQCYACLAPLSKDDQESPFYYPPHSCPHCYEAPEEQENRLRKKRLEKLSEVTNPLPGSIAYENILPLNVEKRFDQLTLLEFLIQRHPHMGEEYWKEECETGKIHRGGEAVSGDLIVRAGNQFAHLIPATIEPPVNVDIEILHEDDSLVVVNKPAPLPVHPSGRFNRNTLQWILSEVYYPLRLRPAHRLDANTTGVTVFCKTRNVSQLVQPQFEDGSVEKVYLVRVEGHVPWESQICDADISKEAGSHGCRTIVEYDGLAAETVFERVGHFEDGTSLLRAFPKTGRTNQIRIHLWYLEHPVLGDPLYLGDHEFGEMQTSELDQPMCLHASQISFIHPETDERVVFSTADPAWAEFS